MPRSWQHYLTSLILLLAAGTFVGWLYAYPERGLLVAALLALVWQVRRLLTFERALRTRDFDEFRLGEGIWQQLFSRFSHERQRARKYKRSYRKLLKEVRKSTNAMPDGSIILNSAFEILHCNNAAQELAGFRKKQDRGQRADNILRDPRFVRYLHSGKHKTGVEIMSPIHEGHWLFCRLVPYGADQYLLLISDVTERRTLSVMRRDFVANASHELRSPLTVISGYLDSLAEDSDIDEAWKRPIEQMRAQACRMNNIVSELLELSRIESSPPADTEQVVDVAGLLASARKSYAGIEKLAKIDVQADSQIRLLGNASEIESVIANLLSNAVRHTPPDGQITLSWNSDSAGAALAVSDTGEGISEEHLPRLTERFFRVDSGRSREGGGIGLGLAIVKHVLLRHDAQLEITSTPGEGSQFICRFPAARLAVDDPPQAVPKKA